MLVQHARCPRILGKVVLVVVQHAQNVLVLAVSFAAREGRDPLKSSAEGACSRAELSIARQATHIAHIHVAYTHHVGPFISPLFTEFLKIQRT